MLSEFWYKSCSWDVSEVFWLLNAFKMLCCKLVNRNVQKCMLRWFWNLHVRYNRWNHSFVRWNGQSNCSLSCLPLVLLQHAVSAQQLQITLTETNNAVGYTLWELQVTVDHRCLTMARRWPNDGQCGVSAPWYHHIITVLFVSGQQGSKDGLSSSGAQRERDRGAENRS